MQAIVKYRDDEGQIVTDPKNFGTTSEAESFAAAAVKDGFSVTSPSSGKKFYPAEAVLSVEVTG